MACRRRLAHSHTSLGAHTFRPPPHACVDNRADLTEKIYRPLSPTTGRLIMKLIFFWLTDVILFTGSEASDFSHLWTPIAHKEALEPSGSVFAYQRHMEGEILVKSIKNCLELRAVLAQSVDWKPRKKLSPVIKVMGRRLTLGMGVTQGLLPHVAESDGAFAAAVHKLVAVDGVED